MDNISFRFMRSFLPAKHASFLFLFHYTFYLHFSTRSEAKLDNEKKLADSNSTSWDNSQRYDISLVHTNIRAHTRLPPDIKIFDYSKVICRRSTKLLGDFFFKHVHFAKLDIFAVRGFYRISPFLASFVYKTFGNML